MHKVFGVKENAGYFDRYGAYIIPVRGEEVGVVRTPKGFFLLGGGIEGGESHDECIARECLEEAGYAVSVGDMVCTAETYCYHEKIGFFHPIQTYYRGELGGKVSAPTESDHEFMWVRYGDIRGKMFLAMQDWALANAFGKRVELGLCRGNVTVEPHNELWEAAARQTVSVLRELLRGAAVDIQHVGSTAVKGICAKPIIDIAVGVTDFGDVLALNEILAENGFIFRGQDVPEQYLYVCGGFDYRTHHIHIVRYGSEAWENYLNMRDYLNSHSEDARAYSELKRTLAEQFPDDREGYTNMKSTFISDILTKAREWTKRYQAISP